MTTVPSKTFRTDPDVVATAARHFARDIHEGGARAATAALDMQSVNAREVLARMIDPHMDFTTLVADAADPSGSLSRITPEAPIGHLLNALARTVAHQRLLESDLDHALDLFRVARHHICVADWDKEDRVAYAKALWTGHAREDLRADEELLAALPRETRAFIQIDLHGTEHGVGTASWLALLNAHLLDHDVTPITLKAATFASTPFDRLSPGERRPPAFGPLISVVMPAFRPGGEILTAVRSIIDQTWQDWELLVVDDASGAEFDAVFDQVEKLDKRVRVLRQPVNQGTYAARNRALDESRGEFITCQDIDDWSHPERLERQVSPLLDDPSLLRTFSRSIRCSDDLVFQYPGYPTSRTNASSHLFRRTVLDSVGRFDWVRKAGDTEFDWRLDAAYPGRRLHIRQPLAFVRLQSESLSRGDFAPEWMHPARVEYRASVLHWHGQIAAGATNPFIPNDVAKRPLTAPRPFLPDRGAAERPVDIAFLADWTMDGASQRAALDEMRLLASSGAHVGLVHVRSIFSEAPRRAPLAIAARRALASGTVTFVSLEESDHIPLVVIRQAEALEFPSSRPVRLTTDRVIVVADSTSEQADHPDRRWSVGDCDHNAWTIFRTPPVWMVTEEGLRDPVSRHVGPGRVSDELYPTVLDLDARASRGCRPFRGQRPVVGWVSGHETGGLPGDRASLPLVLPTDGSVDVRLLGGGVHIRRLLGHIPPQWLVFDAGEVSARELAQQVDFIVGFPPSGPTFETLRTVHEALEAGCVAVLDPAFARYFGDAVITCEVGEVTSVVNSLRGDSEAFHAQCDRGRRWTYERFGGSRDRLATVLGTASVEGERSVSA